MMIKRLMYVSIALLVFSVGFIFSIGTSPASAYCASAGYLALIIPETIRDEDGSEDGGAIGGANEEPSEVARRFFGSTSGVMVNCSPMDGVVFHATGLPSFQLKSVASLFSTIGIVSTGGIVNGTITNIPFGTMLTSFKAGIQLSTSLLLLSPVIEGKPSIEVKDADGITRRFAYTSVDTANSTFEVYDEDGTTVATTLATGKKVIVTAENGIMKATYTVTVNAGLNTVATLVSSKGTVSTGGTANEAITNIPNGTTLAALKAAITPVTNATFEVYDADGTTVATTLATGKKVIVTAEDGTTKVTYTVTVNAAPSSSGVGGSAEVSVNPTIDFSDISGHWAEANITQAVSGGIVGGYPDGTFKPDKTVTRAEFAVMLMNTLKSQGEGAVLTFTDTALIGSWAQKSIAQAVQAGIINGYEDGTFRPDATITRVEMATMIANALKLSIDTESTIGFADDKNIPSWAKGAVAAIKKLGLVEGKGTNEFDPNGKTTRAEAVTVLLKVLVQKSK